MFPEHSADDPLLEGGSCLEEDDPLLEEIVDAAMDGFTELVPPEVAAFIRDSVRDRILFHPEGQRLLRQTRPDPSVDASRNVARRRASPAADPLRVAPAVDTSNAAPCPKKRPR